MNDPPEVFQKTSNRAKVAFAEDCLGRFNRLSRSKESIGIADGDSDMVQDARISEALFGMSHGGGRLEIREVTYAVEKEFPASNGPLRLLSRRIYRPFSYPPCNQTPPFLMDAL